MKTLLALGAWLLLWPLSAQITLTETFSDNNLSHQPRWWGDLHLFAVNQQKVLQLADTAGGNAQLYLPFHLVDSLSWEMDIRLDFAPSASNRLQIILLADQLPTRTTWSGYYLEIGESGNDDALQLFRREHSSKVLLWRGSAGTVASNPDLRLRITRSPAGFWEFFLDPGKTGAFESDGSTIDPAIPQGACFGFFCQYSASRSDKFFFDNIRIFSSREDVRPPVLFSATATDDRTVLLQFDEALAPDSILHLDRYSISSGIQVLQAEMAGDPATVELSVSPMTSGVAYNVTVSEASDLYGNTAGQQSQNFTFWEAQPATPFDLLINEIMADPSPPQELPEAEYLELYNRSPHAIQLEEITLADNTGNDRLGNYLLPPDSFVLLCDDDLAPAFQQAGFTNILPLPSFPTLTNGGEKLTLISNSGDTLHQIEYTPDWYGDSEKAGGGWSLELINPDLICREGENWSASASPLGGTPGFKNAVHESAPDTVAPELLNLQAVDSKTMLLTFSEAMDKEILDASLFAITPGAGPAVSVKFHQNGKRQVLLTITSPFFQDRQSYELQIDTAVADCSGNRLAPDSRKRSFTYYEPKPADRHDILINEILAKPGIGDLPQAEYLEFFNRSDKAIQLEGFQLEDETSIAILDEYLLLPGAYLILAGPEQAASFENYGAVMVLPGFPNLRDGGEQLQLLSDLGLPIHEVQYSASWFTARGREAWSAALELANPGKACYELTNWSPSQSISGGTPGRPNSVLREETFLEGPQLLHIRALAEDSLLLQFGHVLDPSAQFPGMFAVEDAGAVQYVHFKITGNDQTEVKLSLLPPFLEDSRQYILLLDSTLRECTGNPVAPEQRMHAFTYIASQPPGPFDLLINEVMADPTLEGGGTAGLPEKEYLELYNRSNKVINLRDLKLRIGDRLLELPFSLLFPQTEVLLCEAAVPGYEENSNAFPLDNWPGLPNSGGSITLEDKTGHAIHAIDYDISWYGDGQKTKGGYSLELINPSAPCLGQENWQASRALPGGTPGAPNSVLKESPDQHPPDLIRAFPPTDRSVRLYFSESLDPENASDPQAYEIQDGNVIRAIPGSPLYNTVLLELDHPLLPGEIYDLRIRHSLTDCVGNPIGLYDTARVALPQQAVAGDVVINEILFNPVKGGADYVELLNRSGKVLGLSDLFLSRPASKGSGGNTVAIDHDYLLFPGRHVVLSEDPAQLLEQYHCTGSPEYLASGGIRKSALIKQTIPTLPDEEGALLLYTVLRPDSLQAVHLDSVAYSEDWHHPLLTDPEGVSLERIVPSASSADHSNWHSGASPYCFGTPTYRNAHALNGTPQEDRNWIWLGASRLSPDGDGREDLLRIHYQLPRPGFVASAKIFDLQGREVAGVANNKLLSSGEGFLQWNGATDRQGKALIGLYVVFVEMFHPDGEVVRFKSPVVVAGRGH